MNKESWLKEHYENHGDFELQKLIPAGDKHKGFFPTWILYSQATWEQITEANVRSLTKEECCLDIETKDDLQPILQKLKALSLNFEVWDTGSRGFHIILIFEGLKDASDDCKKLFRKFLCEYFNTDRSKGSSRTMIAIEYTPHFKSGRIKVPVMEYSNPGQNKSCDKLLWLFIGWLLQQPNTQPTRQRVEVGLEQFQGKPSFVTIEKLKQEPLIWNLLNQEYFEHPSGKDFAVAKCCVEKKISFSEFVKVLSLTKWSKIHCSRQGITYAQRTYENAYRKEYASSEEIKW